MVAYLVCYLVVRGEAVAGGYQGLTETAAYAAQQLGKIDAGGFRTMTGWQ